MECLDVTSLNSIHSHEATVIIPLLLNVLVDFDVVSSNAIMCVPSLPSLMR